MSSPAPGSWWNPLNALVKHGITGEKWRFPLGEGAHKISSLYGQEARRAKGYQMVDRESHRGSKIVYYYDALDRRSFNGLLLRCLSHEEAQQALQEVHALLIEA
ncbi:hypothetical protein RND71_042280 [Anisodus tanguticus]|uniref:Uncharacterized protein n=1 Tax=Anisodus tanguticus TaxID=243964 RepID=A0AAE1UMV6_9SOLA|nr:hypothetical protein RND71_042280 [Anisodus tanguticus]